MRTTSRLALLSVLAIAAVSFASMEEARASTPPPPTAAAEPTASIDVAIGDTLVPIFSVLKDTVMDVIRVNSSTGLRGATTVRKCGSSALQLRVFRRGIPVHAVTLQTQACAPPVISCDSLSAAIGFSGKTSTSPAIQQLFNRCQTRILPETELPLSG